MAAPGQSEPGYAEAIAEFAGALSAASLTAEVADALVTRIVDTLGCMRGAASAEPVARVYAMQQAFGGRVDNTVPAASIVGGRGKLPVEAAAFVNGIAARYLDFNDIYLSREAIHPSDNVSVALALAEALRCDGMELLLGLARGYEVHCRLADAVSTRKGGWDNVILGAIAAAVMASSLFRLEPAQSAQAINIAATGNVALMQTRVGSLTMWKAIAAAYAARAGLTAALLAKHGVSGPNHALDGKNGLFAQVTGHPDSAAFAPTTSRLQLLDTHLKAYPAQYFTQTAVDAALQLRDRVRIAAIRRIEVATFEFGRVAAADSDDKWHPRTRETADHSMPYCVAAALLDGCLAERQFDQTRIDAADVRALMAKIVVVEEPLFTKAYPHRVPTRIRIEHDDGSIEEVTVDYPTGHSRNRMRRDQVEAKYVDLAGPESEEHLSDLWRVATLSGPQTSALLLAVVS